MATIIQNEPYTTLLESLTDVTKLAEFSVDVKINSRPLFRPVLYLTSTVPIVVNSKLGHKWIRVSSTTAKCRLDQIMVTDFEEQIQLQGYTSYNTSHITVTAMLECLDLNPIQTVLEIPIPPKEV